MNTSSEKTKAPVGAGADGTAKQTPNILAGAQKASNLGATPDDWAHFDLVLGLGNDLLPVVCNQEATISPDSSLRALGKTPSDYNGKREARGIRRWTTRTISPTDLERWSGEPDYGICVRSSEVRGLDVDITDRELARQVRNFIARELGRELPCRYRSNSSKFLHPFLLPGEYGKRVIHCGGDNNIEFLMTSQQFVAVGTHPSGVRYEWEDGLPMAIPVLTQDQFERLFEGLQREFGTREPTRARERDDPPHSGGLTAPSGDLARIREALAAIPNDDNGLDYDAWRNVIFAIHHATGGSDEGLALAHEFSAKSVKYDPYFLDKGVWPFIRDDRDGGITERTLFKMAEAHGWANCIPDDFGDVVRDGQPRPDYERNLKTGEIKATAGNTVKALSDRRECGMELAYDEFRDEICYSSDNGESWIPFRDADYMRLRIRLEQIGFRTPTKEITRDAVQLVAENHAFDSAQEWLKRLTWDGVPRVERFFATYFGTPDTPYARAVGCYTWTALAGRVMEPGCKADMLPILYGAQGLRKSSGVAAIAPSEDFFTEVSFHEKDDDLSRKMRGHLVAELGELRGLHSKDLESIKSWTARRYEKWVPKFKEFSTQYPRRLVIFGTTNQKDFLADQTGNRRWLPLEVGLVDVDGIARDRLQLWAEGRELFARGGVDFREAEALAIGEHGEYTMADAWEDSVQCWLNTEGELDGCRPCDQEFVSSLDIFTHALNIEPRNLTRAHEMRLSRVMKALGYEGARKSVDGGRARGWARTCRNLHVHPHIAE
ncbi:VapE domain-containing protein [Aeromonas dhakensis]|uniref:VapE domain-containing protein n=1 Tax=Aeromonas dhakensis TaxID=196024 RepID=UPI0028D9B861|nr:PriCT-2 domain-containing protein [Aeromonas dhakensis]